MYTATHEVDLSALSPQVVLPGRRSHATTKPVGDLVGTTLQHAYIGSCASGRIEEIRAAAEILEGRRVADGVTFNVVPTSKRIYDQAASEGLWTC